jgi:hypothetical protein
MRDPISISHLSDTFWSVYILYSSPVVLQTRPTANARTRQMCYCRPFNRQHGKAWNLAVTIKPHGQSVVYIVTKRQRRHVTLETQRMLQTVRYVKEEAIVQGSTIWKL